LAVGAYNPGDRYRSKSRPAGPRGAWLTVFSISAGHTCDIRVNLLFPAETAPVAFRLPIRARFADAAIHTGNAAQTAIATLRGAVVADGRGSLAAHHHLGIHACV
jgi:hypothetical protein